MAARNLLIQKIRIMNYDDMRLGGNGPIMWLKFVFRPLAESK